MSSRNYPKTPSKKCEIWDIRAEKLSFRPKSVAFSAPFFKRAALRRPLIEYFGEYGIVSIH